MRQHVLRAEPGRLEIDTHEPIPVVAGHGGGVEVGVDAGVVDEDRGRPECARARVGHGSDVGLAADIGGDEPRLATELLLDGLAERRVEIAEHHRCAVGDEHLDDSLADPSGASGDDRDLAFER